jgi:hypothetical protein
MLQRLLVGTLLLETACGLGPQRESEPNDSMESADGPFRESLTIEGSISNADDDYFAVELEEGATLSVETDNDGFDPEFCAGSRASITLLDAGGGVLERQSGGCPSLATDAMGAGTYFVQLDWVAVTEWDSDYQLTLTIGD